MKPTIIIIIIIIIAAIGLFTLSGPSEPAETGPIKIGVTLPLTGNLAFLGEDYRDAINLALSEAENTKYKYEIVFEDDKFDPATGATTANKLIDVDKVAVLISFGSPVGNVVSPIAEKSKTPHINGIASDPNVAIGDYNFVHWTPPYEESKLMVSEMNKRDIKNVVLIEQNQPGVLAVTNAFKKDIENTDIKLLASEGFNTGERDFRTIISKVKSLGADIYLLEATSPELEILTEQLREAGIATPFTSVEAFEFTGQPELFEGMWYVSAAEQSTDFINTYTSEYSAPPKLGAGNGYDVVNMIIHSIEKTGNGKTKPSSEEIIKELSKIKNFDGAMGQLTMDSDGIVITKAVVRMIKDGKPVTISK